MSDLIERLEHCLAYSAGLVNYVSRIEADQRIEEQISRAEAAEIRVQRTEAEADGLQRMFDCLVAEHNQLRKENEAAEAKLREKPAYHCPKCGDWYGEDELEALLREEGK